MKKTALIVVLALALTFIFTATAFATTGKFYQNSVAYYTWGTPSAADPMGRPYVGQPIPAFNTTVSGVPAGVSNVGSNTVIPGAHAGYLATTAKCGMCHSVHRATADVGRGGVKLLPGTDTSCAGCHTGNTAITAKLITWTAYDPAWQPVIDLGMYPGGVTDAQFQSDLATSTKALHDNAMAAITNQAAAGGAANGGGPHNDSAVDLMADGYWTGIGPTPAPSFTPGTRYGCYTRRCHATSPHGVNASKYKLFAAKLLFNDTPAQDDANYPLAMAERGAGDYDGLDSALNSEGAIDASVDRFVAVNGSVIQTVAGGDIQIRKTGDVAWRAPDTAEKHALVAGLTCGRPSNPFSGEDECHAEASYAIFDKAVHEQRNKSTGITSVEETSIAAGFRTDNTGEEELGYGGNDSRTWKTGHVAGSFVATSAHASYTAISGCTSCHDQKDYANTEPGNFTFPHGEVAAGASNLTTDGVNPLPAGSGVRARIWMGYAGKAGDPLVALYAGPGASSSANGKLKAYDGNCLKCHRNAAGTAGIGITK